MQPTKEITPVYATFGKRRKLIGFRASFDGTAIGTFEKHAEAERALEEIAWDAATWAGVHVLAPAGAQEGA